MKKYTIGLDYGSDSVRAVLIDTNNGAELATEVHWYKRWKKNQYCKAEKNQFRQHPLDHIEGIEFTIKSVILTSGVTAESIVGICIDTTGSSPLPLNKEGVPLSLTEEFKENPNAMMILWKDHTAIEEANEINELAANWGGENYTKYEGGVYSSEWFWAKILHVIREDEAVKNNAHTWMEHCDYITYLLADNKDLKTFKRSRCAAGHKAMWHESWDGLPPEDFLSKLDPYLGELRGKLYDKTYTSNEIAGKLNQEWADKLGLSTNTVIAVGTFDAHAGAIGAKIGKHSIVRVMGTSTCDIVVSDVIGDNIVRGICGQVNGSVIPGMVGLEAGQSAFGDVLAWLKDTLSWPIDNLVMTSSILSEKQKQDLQEEIDANFIRTLAAQAENIPLSDAIPIALDWINGRRTPDANQELTSAISGISLGTKAPHIFKAFVNAICFGSKMIVDRFEEEGVKINTVIGIGGVARKSPFIMQTLANVLNMPIKVAESDQASALGAAIYAAVAAGIFENVIEASKVMGSDFEVEYFPQVENVIKYEELLKLYITLGQLIENEIKFKSMNSKYKALKLECYEANMQLNELGLVVHTFGNVSAVDRENDVFAIKPSGVPYEKLKPEDIVIVNFDNNIIEGNMRPSSDTKTHAYLYKHWKDIGGITHTHSTYAVSWAQAQKDIPIFGTTHADHLTTDIPCAAPMSDELIQGNYEHNTGIQIIDCFKEKGLFHEEVEMILIGNHGPFVWGKDAAKSVYNSKVLEVVAEMAYLTFQINPSAQRLKDSLIKKHYERKHGNGAYYGQ